MTLEQQAGTSSPAHDPAVLQQAREAIEGCLDTAAMRDLVLDRVRRNEEWRGRRCVNLVAAEAPTSPLVRRVLSSEAGTRASGGAIGRDRRWFSAMAVLDELEALCVELLKRAFACSFADPRLLGGMHATMVAYTALAAPGDTVLVLGPDGGGDSSHTAEGPPAARGVRLASIPVDASGLDIDLDRFAEVARRLRPPLAALGQTTTLFPLPVTEIREIIGEWGGRLYVDAAHQAGLIAGGAYPDPLAQGADLVTASSGKTFCGPQGGFALWNDPALAEPVSHTIFPVLTGSHQLNRVAALAVATTEVLEYGADLAAGMVRNARCLAAALHERGVPVLGAGRGFTSTHQVLVDARGWGGGFAAASRLAEANLVVNQQPLPGRDDTAFPGGVRLGTAEVTRLGMGTAEMARIAGFLAAVLRDGADPAAVREEVVRFREPFQTVYYCHESGRP
ncbi:MULTISPECIES: serine hydroxymethyltransferase [Amycolatopsis]|uniref:Glycine hydroxymethyltransferase n=2 Tax=Amycolatopsis TaxID=1813 RepID=A0A1I3XE64_9PSEU|nr:aminotransferase class I/II-fold pyridoxal phosphate-dependent enzyme [Amycolatopsis sacchari]SFK17346.1 glycine hydroxymethyltransferase [Amycolatopsis sacchari]